MIFGHAKFQSNLLSHYSEHCRVYSLISGGIYSKLDWMYGLNLLQDKRFEFGNGEDKPPTTFSWKGSIIELNNTLASKMPPHRDNSWWQNANACKTSTSSIQFVWSQNYPLTIFANKHFHSESFAHLLGTCGYKICTNPNTNFCHEKLFVDL